MGCWKFSKDFSDDSPARMWMGIWWEFVWNGKMMINPGISTGPLVRVTKPYVAAKLKTSNFMKGLSVIRYCPSWLQLFGPFGPLARALGEAENSLVVSLERERHWPRCQAAHLAESQRWFYAKPWNQWRKTSKASGKRLHNELERSTMLLMGKSTISTGPCSIAMLVITRG